MWAGGQAALVQVDRGVGVMRSPGGLSSLAGRSQGLGFTVCPWGAVIVRGGRLGWARGRLRCGNITDLGGRRPPIWETVIDEKNRRIRDPRSGARIGLHSA